MPQTVLRIDTSPRIEGSVSRDLTATVLDKLTGHGHTEVIKRDISGGLPVVSEAWINANFTALDDRTETQTETLALSDALVAELEAADTVVIGLPIYNFSVPASLKTWIDMVARAGRTFRYTDTGPVGLLTGKRAIVVVASGGTQAGSDIDFATNYVRHFLGFIGITDVTLVTADQMMLDPVAALATAQSQIAQIAA